MRKNCSQVVLENFFEPCVLYLLLKKNSYGYELYQNLQKFCKCNVNMGNLYRGLNRLNKNGNISKTKMKSAKGPDKVIYSLSDKGRNYLNGWIENLEKQQAVISSLITNYKNL